MKLLKAAASLKLTVILLIFSMILIFIGTLAQTELGIWQAVDAYFRSWIAIADFSLMLPNAPRSIPVPIPGGLLICTVMIINLCAAHVIRFKATRKRIGIIVLHAGLIVLLAGEIVTGFMADEGMMSIDEGQSSSYIEDIRSAELSVIDPSDPNTDRVVTIPASMVARAARSGQRISDQRIPFSIQVDRWMNNAALFKLTGPSQATSGVGLEARAEDRPQVTGVEGAQSDRPASYVTLYNGDEKLGTWLLWAGLIDPQRVQVDDIEYGIALRYRRTYLPYTLHLKDFRHDIFVGTTIPRNFSSDIRLVDPENQTDRELRIWMNNPLRYAGRTFYQASYKPDGSGTVLQVVRNPGWLMPYVSCILVGLGMTWHFMQSLITFLKRQGKTKRSTEASQEISLSKGRLAWPTMIFVLGVLIAVSGLFRSGDSGDLNVAGFSHLPVSSGGRIKPMDTAARSMLMQVGGRQKVKTEDGSISASKYLIDLIAHPKEVSDLPVVRVDHPDLLAMIGLKPEDSGRVPLSAFDESWGQIDEQAKRASLIEAKDRDLFQKSVLDLHHRVNTLLSHAQMRDPFAIPPLTEGTNWRPFYNAYIEEAEKTLPHPSIAYYASMMTAVNEGNPGQFNAAVREYTELLNGTMPGLMERMKLEVLFNKADLFMGTTVVYLISFLLIAFSFVLRGKSEKTVFAERLRVSAFSMLIAAVLIHTIAIALRIYIQERPPVTNLYSSAVFVGWAAALTGLFLERLYPIGVSVIGSAAIGASTLIIAHNLGNDGDTMEMMQAVLDSNFWLGTHVITITLGYSATFLAGAIGAIYLIARLFTKSMTQERERAMIRMVYGVVCFAMLLSFVGTVLGGIWADQSWGRFWGWDPKENGAALVVLINAIILHARWGGMVKARGIASLAVFGNIVTVWSWFGTNMLGVGLHAYGFMDSAAFWMIIFVISQIVIMMLALIPAKKSA